jgi:hypothetical protein
MKKIITTIALLSFVFFAIGQKMQTSSGAYVKQSPDAYITINGDLSNAGTFLVESTSAGTGSLIITGTASNSGTFTFQRYMSEGVWHYVAEPVNDTRLFNATGFLNLAGVAGSGTDQFYRWDENYTSGSYTGWWIDILNGGEYSTGTFQTAQGYSISYTGTGNQTIDFKGVPQTGDQSISVTNTSGSTGQGSNLVGNPFTSTIAANSPAQATDNFIDKNSAIFETGYSAVYLWDEQAGYDGTQNDYLTINNSSGAAFIEPGQAFMIVAGSSTTAYFHETIQMHASGTSFYKSGGDDISRFEILVKNPEDEINTTKICFIPGMTNGLDESYDARKLSGNPNLALYTLLVEDDGEDYAIQSLPPIADGVSVKLGIRAEVIGTYVFERGLIENIAEDIPINLEDKVTGIVTDLRKNPAYSFDVIGTGANNDRFVLHFKDAVSIEENTSIAANYLYVANNVLYFVDEIEGTSSLQLYNLLGQKVLTQQITDNIGSISLNLPTGYYIVNLTTESFLVNGKVFLK